MFKTIVWATDGSELADSALETVVELARVHSSHIVAIHADERLRGRFGGAPVLADEDDLRDKIHAQVEQLRADGFEAELKFAVGTTHPADELIAEAARQVEADLIVVGTHGRGAIGTAILGSVAKGLLHVAPCPVLVVPPPGRVLAPTDDAVLTA
ncbi:MAG TPA: universal stress protein [Gaiellaceae bacterium]|jgi:nucleotide-binding universal stress UspA family protein|nr:universal stress protein [Gaiellaceae bacterium]